MILGEDHDVNGLNHTTLVQTEKPSTLASQALNNITYYKRQLERRGEKTIFPYCLDEKMSRKLTTY